MAESKREKGSHRSKSKKESKRLADQLEDKWLGSRTEVFSRIAAKEAEIRSKTKDERAKADRLIEDAKGEAAAFKREATLEEIGKDLQSGIIAEAQREAENIEASTADEIATVKEIGELNMDEAVDFIVKAVISNQPHGR